MKDLITKEQKHLLWQDEFLLTKYCEIYKHSDSVLQCATWSPKMFAAMKKKGIVFDDWGTSDGLYNFKTNLYAAERT